MRRRIVAGFVSAVLTPRTCDTQCPMRRRIVAGCSRGGGVGLEGGGGGAGVEVGGADLDAVAASVLHEGVRRVEAHGLGVEQCGAEGGREPALQDRKSTRLNSSH